MQQLTLGQVMLTLFGDDSDKDEVHNHRIEGQIRYMSKLAGLAGLTLPALAALGPPRIVELALQHTGKVIPPDLLYPLLDEPEFHS